MDYVAESAVVAALAAGSNQSLVLVESLCILDVEKREEEEDLVDEKWAARLLQGAQDDA